MSFNIQIHGIPQLNKRLSKIAGIDKELKKTTDRAVKYVHSTVPPYPPTLPNQRYKRTGTLGRSIGTKVKSIGRGYVGTIGTNLVYAPDVISESRTPSGRGPQGRFFAGRWWTLQGVGRKARDGVVKIYEDMIKRLLHGS